VQQADIVALRLSIAAAAS